MKRISLILLSVIALVSFVPNTGHGQAMVFSDPIILGKPVTYGYVYEMTPAFYSYYYGGSEYNYLYSADQDNFCISEDGLGGAVCVWWNYYMYNGNTGVYTYYFIWAQRIDATGNLKWGGTTGIWPATPTGSYGSYPYQWNPRIQGDGAGGAYILWIGQDINNGSRYRLFGQHVDPNGNLKWGANGYPISSLAGAGDYEYYSGSGFMPTMDGDGSGNVNITFNCYNTANTYGNVYAVRVTGDNGAAPRFGWTGAAITLFTGSSTRYITTSTSTASWLCRPVIRSDKAGGAWVTWISYGTSVTPYYYLHVAKINAAGTVQANVSYTDCYYSSYYPYTYNQLRVERDANGGIIVVYGYYYDVSTASYTNNGNLAYYYGWNAMRLSYPGSGTSLTRNWGPKLAGSTTDMYSSAYGYYKNYNGHACADSVGGFTMAYCSYYGNCGTYANTLYTQRMDGNGTVMYSATACPSGVQMGATTGTGYEFNSIINDGSGNAIVAWNYANYSYSSSNPIYINKIKQSDGSKLWGSSPLQLSKTSGYYNSNQYYLYYSSYPYLCQDGAGGAWAAWNHYMIDYITGSWTNFYIVAQHIQDTAAAPHAAAGPTANIGNVRVCPTACVGTTVTNAATVKSANGSNPAIQAPLKITGVRSYRGYAVYPGQPAPVTSFWTLPAPITVAVGSSASFNAVVKAPANGSFTDSLIFQTNDPFHPTIGVAIQGNGIYPHISAAPTLVFPDDHVGSTISKTVTVTNTGTDVLNLSGVTITSGDASNFTANIVGSPAIAAGAQGQINVNFTPTSADPKITNLNIMSDDSQYVLFSKPQVVQLTGNGIFPHVTAANSVAFPYTVAGLRSSNRTFIVTNTGTENLILSNATNITGTNATEFSILNTNLPLTIAPGKIDSIRLKFTPNAVLGDRIATLNVYSNFDSACAPFPCNNFKVSLTGTGVDGAPDMQFAQVLDAGKIHVQTKDTVTAHIMNTTDATKALTITNYSLTGAFASNFTILNAPATMPDVIAIGGSRDIKIQFNANQKQYMIAYLHMLTNAQATPVDITLVGTGAKGVCSAEALDFGKVAISDGADLKLKLTNIGNWDFAVSSFSFVGAGALSYGYGGTPQGAVVKENFGTYEIPIHFAPTAVGTYNVMARVITSDNDTVFFAINGKGVQKGVQYAPQRDTFDLVAINETVNKPLHIVNSGEVPVNITAVNFTNATAPLAFSTDVQLPLVVPAGAEFWMNLYFNSNTGGEKSAQLNISADANLGGKVYLVGFATSQPFDAFPQVLHSELFQGGTLSEEHTVKLRNFTTSARTVTDLSITGPGAAAYRIVAPLSWPFDINGQSGESITVAFEPVAFGSYVATLEIKMGDGSMIPIAMNGSYGPTDVRQGDAVPSFYALSQNYPNPFSGTTQITYQLPERTSVTLAVYDMMGRLVRELVNGTRDAGVYDVNLTGDVLPAGVYTYSLTANGATQSHLMQVVK